MSTLLGYVASAPFDERAYHRRLGVVTGLAEEHDPDMRTSRARQIARTWRSCLAYQLALALRGVL